jgi:hypothetical protein
MGSFYNALFRELTMQCAAADAELFCRKGTIAGTFLEGFMDKRVSRSGKIKIIVSRQLRPMLPQ